MPRLALLGPPGVGKGTQARRIAEKYSIIQISMGDILRQEIEGDTEVGHLVSPFIKKGELVPDPVMIEIIREKLTEGNAKNGFVLDGFPRTLHQAVVLKGMLNRMNSPLDAVINLDASDEILLRRLGGRVVCQDCGFEYHLEFRPPKTPGMCDRCYGELHLRDDDREETIRQRLRVYRKETAPLIDYYAAEGLLLRIDGENGLEQVFNEIVTSLGQMK